MESIAAEVADRHGGGLVSSAAQGVLGRFDDIASALGFATDLQSALLEATWAPTFLARPEACEVWDDDLLVYRGLRVRVGVHMGRVERRQGAVAGPAVYQVARIAAVANGGQVLLSETGWRSFGGGPDSDFVVRDLGEHALTGVYGTSRLFQTMPADLDRRAFAALDTEDHLRTNVAPLHDALLGRQGDTSALEELCSFGVRVVALHGERGVGKSALGRDFARQERETYATGGGCWLVLPTSRSLHGLLRAMSVALDIPLAYAPTLPQAVRRLGAGLASRGAILLVIDPIDPGAEGVREALCTWRQMAPEARLVVHSAAPLKGMGEVIYRVRPLALPTKDEPEKTDAIRLYVLGARRVDPDFELDDLLAVSVVVNEVAGNPLAVRLLAGLCDRLPPSLQAQRLLSGELASGGVLELVWDELDSTERAVLEACAIYPGGFEVGGAHALLYDDPDAPAPDELSEVLERLERRGLLRMAADLGSPEVRRFALDDRVREWAITALEPQRAATLRRRFAHRVLSVCEPWPRRALGRDRQEVVARVAVEWSNLMEIIDGGLHGAASEPDEASEALDQALRALLVLEPLFEERGPLSLQLALHARALEISDSTLGHDPLLQVRVLVAKSNALRRGQRSDKALALLARARDIAERWADREGLARALLAEGRALRDTGESEASVSMLQRCLDLYGELGDSLGVASASESLASHFLEQGRYDDAEALLQMAVHAFRQHDARHLEARALRSLALLFRRTSRPDEARAAYRDTIRILHQIGGRWVATGVRIDLALLDYDLGRTDSALTGLQDAVSLARQIGHRRAEGIALVNIGLVTMGEGRLVQARQLFLQTLAIHRDQSDTLGEAMATGYLGLQHHLSGQRSSAREYYQRAIDQLGQLSQRRPQALFTGWLSALEAECLEPMAARATFDAAMTHLAGLADSHIGAAIAQLRSVLDLMEAELAQAQGNAERAEMWRAAASARWQDAVSDWTKLHGETRFVVRRVEVLMREGLRPEPSTADGGHDRSDDDEPDDAADE